MIRTPLTYYGGKQMLAPEIMKHMLPHRLWVDVFCGGAAVSLAKPESPQEVWNDIGFVASFWKCLQDPVKGQELVRKLRATPWSRREFSECSSAWLQEDDDVEKARRWFVLINQGFTHEESCDSWLISKLVDAASAWVNKVEVLPVVLERLRRVTLECYSFEKVIPLWDATDTLYYCDPPYISNTRRSGGGGYENEMFIEDHELLLHMLNGIKGQAIVSGYSSPLYDQLLKDWRRISVTRRSQIHNGFGKNVGTRTECLWIKEHHYGTLWQIQSSREDSHVS